MIMNSKHEIVSLVAKIAIFIVVYGGIYVSVTSLNTVFAYFGSHYENVSLELLLGALALLIAFGSTIIFHFIIKIGLNGWRLLATITPLLVAIGGILIEYTLFGAVLIAAFVPALMYLVHPAKIDKWTSIILGIDDGGRTAVVLGATAAILLLIEEKMTFTPNLITFLALIIALLASGGCIGFFSITTGDKEREQLSLLDARSIVDVPRIVAVSAYLNLISWALFPLIAILVLKEFSALASYGSSLDPVSVGLLTLISLTIGIALAVIVMIVARGKSILYFLVIAMLCTFGICFGIILLGAWLDGNTIVMLRMIVLVTLPFMIVAMLGIPAQDVKGIAFHFWKGFLVIGSIVLLIIGLGFDFGGIVSIYVIIYFIMIGFAAISTIMNRLTIKYNEVESQ